MDSAARELLFVLILMGVILVVCVIAVFIFFRQWRKEHVAAEKVVDKDGESGDQIHRQAP